MIIEELKSILNVDMPLISEAADNGYCISHGAIDELERLVRAEITQFETTDKDVAEAIEWIDSGQSASVYMNGTSRVSFCKPISFRAFDVIKCALRQYNKLAEPTSEELKKAIEIYKGYAYDVDYEEYTKRYIKLRDSEEYIEAYWPAKYFQIALKALEAYKQKEPCNFEKELMTGSGQGAIYQYTCSACGESFDEISNYCPNCGRKLEVKND